MRGYLAILIAYLLGSIPFGYIFGKLFGTDIRKKGSGNTGATNALRVMGWKLGLLTYIFDFLKGYVSLFVGQKLGVPNWAIAGIILASMIGHCYSVFLSFKGGKGVATGSGLLAYLSPKCALATVVVFISIVYISRYVSLASILSGVFGVILILVFTDLPLVVKCAMVLAAIIIIRRHSENISRLRMGNERKLGEKKDI